MRRAVVLYVEERRPNWLLPQFYCLYESYLASGAAHDTDLVVFGPPDVLARLPDDPGVVAIPQPPASELPPFTGYHFINSVACLAGPGSERLLAYDKLLRSDVDVFLTPTWLAFDTPGFVCGRGSYALEPDVKRRLRATAAALSLRHVGRHDIGSTWYGPTALIRELAALATEVTGTLLRTAFQDGPGQWPGWFRGVASMYGGELAVNHLLGMRAAPSPVLDFPSSSREPVDAYPHIHCWHTEERFSKFAYARGEYDRWLDDEPPLDLGVVRDYALAMALRARRRMRSR